MKRIVSILILLLASLTLGANPASRARIPYTQPDGSVVYVVMHGDEWYHYTTTESGRVVELGEDGYLHSAEKPSFEKYMEAAKRRDAARSPRNAWTPRTDMTMGERHIPVFLIEFQDKAFTVSSPNAAFYNLLNQQGYSAGGGTGSVRDYYYDNSHGQFRPVFDVFGPVKVSGNLADYGGENYDVGACTALFEACQKLDSQVDFSRYDTNSDGLVDMILFYFAGYNQADGARVYNKETIWPHQWKVPYGCDEASTTSFDGKYLDRYFCTSEYKGYTGAKMCGIGTTCHEFAHSLGLPDFYDTDYELNGECEGIYSFSLMCHGSRLNDENTPPYLNLEELRMLGWAGAPQMITTPGEYELSPVNSEYKAYTLPSSRDGEYFLLECRARTGWDSYLPGEGLLVYHVDKSARSISYLTKSKRTITYPASTLWDYWDSFNAINVKGDHPLFRLVPSVDPANNSFTDGEGNIPFPGNASVSSFHPVDWDGVEGDKLLFPISYSGNKVSFTLRSVNTRGLYGKVSDNSVQALSGAKVSVYAVPAAASSPGPRSRRISKAQGSLLSSVTTSSDGLFYFDLSARAEGSTYEVEVSKSGYVTEVVSFTLTSEMQEMNFFLTEVGGSVYGELFRTDGNQSSYYYYPNSPEINGAEIRYLAYELVPFVGRCINSISFRFVGGSGTPYVYVEQDGERVFVQKVSSPNYSGWTTADVSSQNFVIQPGHSISVGFFILGSSSSESPIIFFPVSGTGGYVGEFEGTEPKYWYMLGSYAPPISALLGEAAATELKFPYIDNPGKGVYSAGSRFNLKLNSSVTPSSVNWYYDRQKTAASTIVLSKGEHLIEASLKWSDGSVERIYLNITVQ